MYKKNFFIKKNKNAYRKSSIFESNKIESIKLLMKISKFF